MAGASGGLPASAVVKGLCTTLQGQITSPAQLSRLFPHPVGSLGFVLQCTVVLGYQSLIDPNFQHVVQRPSGLEMATVSAGNLESTCRHVDALN